METQVSQSAGEITAAPKRLSVWRIMIDVLIAPTQGFKNIRHFPRWLIPGIICVLVLLAQEVIIRPQTLHDLRQAVQNDSSLTLSETKEKLAMIDYQLENSVPKKLILRGFALLTVIHFSKILGLSLLLWVVLHLLLVDVSFRQALSLCALSLLAVIPEAIAKIPAAMAQGSAKVYFSLAVLFPANLFDTALFRIFRSLDLFTIWFFILLAIGLSYGLGVRKKHAYIFAGSLLACRVFLSAINFAVIGAG